LKLESVKTSSTNDNNTFTDVTNTAFGVRSNKKSDKVFDLETKKIDLFTRKLEKDDRNDDAELCFLKSLVPEMKKAVRLTKLKRKISEVVDDFLEEEALLYHN
jgi:hypothetical protein